MNADVRIEDDQYNWNELYSERWILVYRYNILWCVEQYSDLMFILSLPVL